MMLRLVCILGAFCILQAHSYHDFLNNHYKNWDAYDLFAAESRAAPETRDVEEITERDREPLAPDYKDPEVLKTYDEKPDEKPEVEEGPSSPEAPAFEVPGGVIDVNANGDDFGFGHFPRIPDSFGFSSAFGNVGNSHFPEGLFGLGGVFNSFAEHKPWWKGENVCIEREESSDDEATTTEEKGRKSDTPKTPNFFSTSVRLSNCQETGSKYECITKINNHGVAKTFIVRYKCCYGFQRSDNSPGCSKKINLVSLLDTIENIKGKEFKNVIQTAGLEETFIKENLTVFVPANEALTDFTESMNELNQVDIARRRRQIQHALSSKQLVLNHVVKGFNDLSDVENEDLLYSENNNNSIRINIYPTRNYGKLVTANCAHVRNENNLASNGIVHVIDGVISPVTQNVLDIIAEHPQLSNLRQALQNTNLTKNFKPNGHYTVFAPTDSAFLKLEDSARQRLIKGDSCAATILKHHIVAHTICSAAVVGHATTHSVDGELLNLQKTEDGAILFEEKAKITKRDIVATNGVIHLVDTIAIPDAALYISESLKKENFTKFLSLIEEAGLANEIDSLKNVTVFAPSDKAFENPAATKLLESIKGDKQKLKDLIMYHTAQGELESSNMNNNMEIPTKNDKKLRLNLYSTLPVFSSVINRATVNCARLTGYDEKSCGSMIHEVSEILTVPTKTLLDFINTSDNFKTLSKILKGTEVEEVLKDDKQSLTFLAPSDEVFERLDEKELNSLTEDKKKANALLKNHILTEVLCCSGIGPHTWGFNTLTSTLSHHQHAVARTGNHIRIGGATLTDCDNVATNGVIHTVNKLLYPHSARSPGFGLFIFDF